MSLGLIDSPYQLPVALIDSIVIYKAEVIPLALKKPHLHTEVLLLKVAQVCLQPIVGNSLPAIGQRKILDIIVPELPVKNTVVKILYSRLLLALGVLTCPRLTRAEAAGHVLVAVLYIAGI